MKTLTSSRSSIASVSAGFSLSRLLRWLLAVDAAFRSRQQLRSLDADRLRDIGISAKDARAQSNRPFWDVPLHWID